MRPQLAPRPAFSPIRARAGHAPIAKCLSIQNFRLSNCRVSPGRKLAEGQEGLHGRTTQQRNRDRKSSLGRAAHCDRRRLVHAHLRGLAPLVAAALMAVTIPASAAQFSRHNFRFEAAPLFMVASLPLPLNGLFPTPTLIILKSHEPRKTNSISIFRDLSVACRNGKSVEPGHHASRRGNRFAFFWTSWRISRDCCSLDSPFPCLRLIRT
jgi:hypothetical protein